MTQTAVEWLVEQLTSQMSIRIENTSIGCDLFEKAKQIEKQQIIDAHMHGHNASSSTLKNFDAEQYYNETFKKD